MTSILVRVSVAIMKQHGQKQVVEGKGGFLLVFFFVLFFVLFWLILSYHNPSLKEILTGTQAGLEPGGRS